MRSRVERLFFCNPAQSSLISRIRETVERTGAPLVIENDNRVWIGVPSGKMQCLFTCLQGAKPVGVALYCRPAPDLIWIAHLAVDPECGLADEQGGIDLAGVLVKKIREIAHSIRGVSRIQLPYRPASFVRVDNNRNHP